MGPSDKSNPDDKLDEEVFQVNPFFDEETFLLGSRQLFGIFKQDLEARVSIEVVDSMSANGSQGEGITSNDSSSIHCFLCKPGEFSLVLPRKIVVGLSFSAGKRF